MDIHRFEDRPARTGPSDWFTGTTRIDPLFSPRAPARTAGAAVTFEPRARTAWHTHPLGQTLIVTAGVCIVQVWDEPAARVRTGDVVWFPPGVKHWHGAGPDEEMTHIAIQESQDGEVVQWLEHVSDEQYEQAMKTV